MLGTEGAFYVWERDKLESILGPKAAELISVHYGVTKDRQRQPLTRSSQRVDEKGWTRASIKS